MCFISLLTLRFYFTSTYCDGVKFFYGKLAFFDYGKLDKVPSSDCVEDEQPKIVRPTAFGGHISPFAVIDLCRNRSRTLRGSLSKKVSGVTKLQFSDGHCK